jgi:putative hydrolase of the HAD superfamily
MTVTHVLFDFFGTLVTYSPSRTEQGYGRSHALVRDLGADLDYAGFLDLWTSTCVAFDRASADDHREHSMHELAGAFLTRALGRPPAADARHAFVAAYLAEWNTGVVYLPGLDRLLADLSGRHRLAVVTNTHHARLVPDHLAAMGLAGAFQAVVTSVEVGWRKPHPAIYAAALDATGADRARTVFVGDTYEADYRGPTRFGLRALLIDPRRRAVIPDDARLASVFDLPARLGGTTSG